ncbi:MAG TPA: carboxypeptidase regulatory-like domain-containing protein [Blastocatellia bacterium]|nr:carboxypeptidase regulatory-like domain-containing protein [Blastocatellia bacterium]
MGSLRLRGRPSRGLIPVCILVLLAWCALPALAQQSVTSATLSGHVEDKEGAGITGATVKATNLDRNQSWKMRSDDHGRFRFPILPVGAYRIEVEHAGFAAFNRELNLSIGQALDLPVTLAIGGITETASVTASDTPLVETVRTQVAGTIAPREVSDLPLNGRNYLDLALLIPAVSRTNTGSNQRFAETSAVPGTGISIAGQRNLYNSFIVDGLSANDDAADLAGTFFSQEVIREFQVVTSGGIAEYGRASGGVVNIVTQSGTNDWHGRLYGFLRNQRFDARNPLAPARDLLTQTQYGASIGGPVVSDRTFLFSNFEQTRRNDSLIITIPSATVATINNRLDQTGFPGPRIETGLVPSGFDASNFFARIDHRLDGNNQFSARYSFYDIAALNSRIVGGLNSVSRGTGLDNRDHAVAVSNVTTLSSKSVNEARFQYTRSRLAAPVNDRFGPAVNISGVASFGTATFSPLARGIDLYEVVDNVTAERGDHSIKAGADFLYNRVEILFPGAFQGVYTFTTLENFLAGAYGSFQQAFGAPSQFQSNPNIGLFVQDEWRARANLTINAGLRYDAQFLPDPINTDANNLAPRIGIAYAPGDHKTVIRASYGIYFDRIPLRATSNALQRDGSKYIVVQLSPTQPEAPNFPNVLAARPESFIIKPNITRIDPTIENSYSHQASLQIEMELPGNASISVGYIHLRGLHLILSRNVNVPRFPASAGVANLGRPDPDWGNISRFESSGDSYYNGMIVSFNKQLSRWASTRVSYTLSKAIDNAGNFFFSTPQDNLNLRDERGLSDNDQRHRLSVSGALEAPRSSGGSIARRAVEGLGFSYIFTYASALPFNIVAGSDRNFDTNFNDRPAGVGRNTGRGFDFASLDLRLSKRFRVTERLAIEAMGESFNTLNHSNFQLPNNTFGSGAAPSASFGRPTAAADPRQIQFGLRLDF